MIKPAKPNKPSGPAPRFGRSFLPALVLATTAGAAEPPIDWITAIEFDSVRAGVAGDYSNAKTVVAEENARPANPMRDLRLFGEVAGVPTVSTPEPSADSLTRITAATEGADFDPQVSRDGNFLIFASTQHRETSDLYLRPVNGSVLTKLTSDPADDVMPAISPDGRRIAFASNRSGNWDLYVMPASGGRAIQVTSGSEHEIHPSWSPDGSRIVFSRYGQTSGQWEMWVVETDNPAVSHFIGYGLFPEWNPMPGTGFAGGDRIVFQRSRARGDHEFTIWCVEYQDGKAGNLSEIATSPTAALINPTWSPSGEHIVFAAVPREEQDSTASLWLIGIDGSGRTNLTSGDTQDLMPAWGENGQVYFVSDRGGREDLWSLDVGEVIRTARGEAPFGDLFAGANRQRPAGPAAPPEGSENPLSQAFAGSGENSSSAPANPANPGLNIFRATPPAGRNPTYANVNEQP